MPRNLYLIAILLTGGSLLSARPAVAQDYSKLNESEIFIDLRKTSWQARRGFQLDPGKEEDWLFLGHPEFPLLPNKIFQEPADNLLAHYSLATSFQLPKLTELPPLNLYLEQIGENWAVYLNGQLLKEEIALSADGKKMEAVRVVNNLVIPIPAHFLREGKNTLLFHIIGRHPYTSLNINSLNGLGRHHYFIAENLSFFNVSLERNLIFLPIIAFGGVFFLLIFLHIPTYRYFFWISCLLINVFFYYLLKSWYLDQYFYDSRLKLKLEYILSTAILPLFLCFIEEFFFPDKKTHFLSKLCIIINVLLGLWFIVGSLPANQLAIRIWQYSMPFYFPWIIYLIGKAVYQKVPDAGKLAVVIALGILSSSSEILKSVTYLPISDTGYITAFGMVLALLFILINSLIRSHREMQRLNLFLEEEKQAISRFVPSQFLHLLGKDSVVDVKLGEQIEREMTILFADIRSFTALSETMTPQENFNFINSYLKHMGPIIRKHHGFIDKYIGDGIMALFPDSAEDAINAAIELQTAVYRYNQLRAEVGYQAIEVGVGLHHGRLMLGTIGESQRMEGTVISDTVNVAARLESLNKVLLTKVVLSQAILDQIDKEIDGIRPLGSIKVRGKKASLPVYEIFSFEHLHSRRLKEENLADFSRAIQAINEQSWEKASHFLKKVIQKDPTDRTAVKLYQITVQKPEHDAAHASDLRWNDYFH